VDDRLEVRGWVEFVETEKKKHCFAKKAISAFDETQYRVSFPPEDHFHRSLPRNSFFKTFFW